jgi:pimeloyl-ACP methyl ester carboxylesterase
VSDDQPTWVLLHGTPLGPACWAEVASRLRPYGRVETPSVPPLPGDTTPQHDIAQRVAAGLTGGSRDLHVVGHSFGGQIALELALAAPERIRTLTIVCSRGTPYPPFATVAVKLRDGQPVDIEAGIARWFAPDEVAADGPVVRYARESLSHPDRSAWAVALDAIATYDASERVRAITAPTNLIAAERDGVSTPEAMAELAELAENAHLDVIAGASHMSPFVDPDDLARRLLAGAERL